MQRIVTRTLPSGKVVRVHPFHVCLKGTESSVLCRDEEDYDVMVKIIAVASKRKDVIVVIYTVVSNHSHAIVLASSQSDAFAFGEEIKRVYSMWFSHKYGEKGIMRRIQTSALWLYNDWYVRNALAYVPRNAMDNGCSVDEYRWSGYSAMFRSGSAPSGRRVSGLTRREKERILHAFSEECVERIKREIDTNNASREYNTELQKLIHTFGQNTWEKMEDSSRSFLVSSKIAFNNLINIENNVDYSGVCLLVTKALEVEMSKRFGKNFLAYLKGKYRGKENYYQFPTALLNTYYDENNTPHKKPIRPKDFTLGKLPYVMCLFYTNGITDEQKENYRQKLIEYAKEKLFNEKTDEEILEILKDFAEAIEEVKKDYRNPSAHTNQVKRIDAEECFNLVIDVEKLLKRILDSFKS